MYAAYCKGKVSECRLLEDDPSLSLLYRYTLSTTLSSIPLILTARCMAPNSQFGTSVGSKTLTLRKAVLVRS